MVNVLDVLVVWYVIYVLMMLLRGTKAVQLFKGVVVIIVVKLISWYVGLETLSWIMDQVINWGIIAIIVISSLKSDAVLNTWGAVPYLRHIIRKKITKRRWSRPWIRRFSTCQSAESVL